MQQCQVLNCRVATHMLLFTLTCSRLEIWNEYKLCQKQRKIIIVAISGMMVKSVNYFVRACVFDALAHASMTVCQCGAFVSQSRKYTNNNTIHNQQEILTK